jgi:hypothetical protein
MYLPSFSLWQECIEIEPDLGDVRMPIALFQHLITLLGRGGAVDEDWYKNNYKDIQEASRKGTIKDMFVHFGESGFFEGRFPAHYAVDEAWYTRRYPDVMAAISAGEISSGQVHFFQSGYAEGRIPSPSVAAELEPWIELFGKLKRRV